MIVYLDWSAIRAIPKEHASNRQLKRAPGSRPQRVTNTIKFKSAFKPPVPLIRKSLILPGGQDDSRKQVLGKNNTGALEIYPVDSIAV